MNYFKIILSTILVMFLLVASIPALGENEEEECFNQGYNYYCDGNYEEALVWYDKALELDPENLDTLICKGWALDKGGKYEESLKCYEKVLELAPEFSDVWFNKGVALANLGKSEEAMECYEKAIETRLEFIDPETNVAQWWFNKGFNLETQGNYSEAIRFYDKTLEIDPAHANAKKFKENAQKALEESKGE